MPLVKRLLFVGPAHSMVPSGLSRVATRPDANLEYGRRLWLLARCGVRNRARDCADDDPLKLIFAPDYSVIGACSGERD